ncbi:hypothetical protein CHGG_02466 [Chaetomium globosum CBS 148.51]|uniref:Non-haem dioxygenase N-terminal domain-containing protein n=1 Tax=Chaetomium globosum (strain ATCC 6205 / CBS 148.51 / DSM 1962 / NBRC 6347 / NRRL 1970) TaxID=306901 RepID=Q2HBD8_CHAGB|nr:uncharacterized protein CHGG_02466 [Chaetomium globosum CBS 148.51]EAQ90531.1 hypothetical protein CHGG_02466 [Chaetomium globosum CBS 148.51]
MGKIANIPIIDISEGDQTQVAQDLVEAAIEHGFQAPDIAQSKRLFEAPLSEKQACTIQKNNRGWSGMNYETLDPANQRVGDFKEAFNFGDFLHHRAQQPLPPSIAADEPRISAFRDLCYQLSLKLTTLLGHGLADHVGARAGGAAWRGGGCGAAGVGQCGGFVVVLDGGPVEEYGASGCFSEGEGEEGGDGVGVDGEGDGAAMRYSIAYFCHPFGGTELKPVPSERVRAYKGGLAEGNPYAERRVMTADEHLKMRLKASYAQLYEEKDKGKEEA